MKKLKICIVGGGNSTHTLVPLLSNAGHTIVLLTRNPKKWSETITMEYTDQSGRCVDTLNGNISLATDNVPDALNGADVILLSLPVHIYRVMLHEIAPHIPKDRMILVGTIYGQGGFNWMMDEIIRDYNLPLIEYFSFGLLPWITRTKEYGKIGINYGAKYQNVIAVSSMDTYDFLENSVLDDFCFNYFKKGKFALSGTFLALTLSVDNQIIHLSRLYGLYLSRGGKWESLDEVPLFYRDFDDVSADVMRKLDQDYSLIRQSIVNAFPQNDYKYMLDYLGLERLSYNSSNVDIKESFTSSETLGLIPTPVLLNNEGTYIFNKNHRFFKDDLYYGLVIAKWFAEKLNVSDTPTLDVIINWAQGVTGDIVMEDGMLTTMSDRKQMINGNPSLYGYSNVGDMVL